MARRNENVGRRSEKNMKKNRKGQCEAKEREIRDKRDRTTICEGSQHTKKRKIKTKKDVRSSKR